ncbi:hypothetical protein CVT25_015708 [Psilocybe cyanescens]|uniref:Uncharacterized protein n=1 Tax=Psilocybe cyanescens TaxID=93625 RepID=A0A409X1K0_PSICY|nr:hypothetical protein CVT25_015708 [Psilocybe cyanescens]
MPYFSHKDGPLSAGLESTFGVGESKIQDVKEFPASETKLLPDTTATTLREDIVEEKVATSYPLVKLEVDKVTDATAGRLATSLLGHVLFLKNQVPFPVMQLGRIPGGKTNTRAAKQRTELLASYDTISSHLDTTFSALSTALSRCAGYDLKLAQAHLAILVGPSLITAKSKLILGIDGLEPSIWGTRDEANIFQQNVQDSGETEDEDGEDEDEDGDDDDDNDDEESDGSEEMPQDSEDEESGEEDSESESEEENVNSKPANDDPPPTTYMSRAEEQRFLQNADRLLSRTLAAADAEGNGISSELSPTQTHILIRAPRRFNHPAWLPRQNATATLDMALQDFLNNSGLGTSEHEVNSCSKHVKKSKIEGVWITTRQGLRPSALLRETSPSLVSHSAKDLEDDEMIWWSWDGKFQGFSDW